MDKLESKQVITPTKGKIQELVRSRKAWSAVTTDGVSGTTLAKILETLLTSILKLLVIFT